MPTSRFMISILVRQMSVGLIDGEWLEDDEGDVAAGDVADRVAAVRDFMQFDA